MSRLEFGRARNAWILRDIDPHRRPAEQIAERIREAIRDGVWRQGQELPGSPEIARRYGVAASTAHRALGLLVKEGVLSTPGKPHGHFVRGVQ